jgi:multiple sugar transport system substrate-binding protein
MALEKRISRRAAIQQTLSVTATLATGGCGILTPRQKYPGRKTVRFWHLLSGDWQAPLEKVVARFNESQTKYEVAPILIPGDSADSKFLLSVSGGVPPDVMLHWTQAISTWAEGGLLYPLDTLMTREERHWMDTEAFPVIKKSGFYKGRLYSLVMGFDLYVCYYRPDHFREAGLDPDRFPQTLEELSEVGAKLNRFDKAGNLTRMGFMPQGFKFVAPSFGKAFYDAATDQVLLNTEENRRALTFLADERRKLGFDKVLRFTSSITGGFGIDWPFVSDSYSIVLDGEWHVEQLRKFAPQIEYRTIPFPPPVGGRSNASFSETNFLTIPAGAKEVDGAWDFIRFWTGLENPTRAAEFYPWLGWMPMGEIQVKTPAYQKYLQQCPQYRTFLDVAESENVEITPPVPYQLYLIDAIRRADDLAMRGTLTPEQALMQLERDVNKERARRKALGYHV